MSFLLSFTDFASCQLFPLERIIHGLSFLPYYCTGRYVLDHTSTVPGNPAIGTKCLLVCVHLRVACVAVDTDVLRSINTLKLPTKTSASEVRLTKRGFSSEDNKIISYSLSTVTVK